VEVVVSGPGAGGVGVGHLPDGRVVFLPLTVPGDRVRVRITVAKARWCRGEVEELVEEGPGRRTPPCPHYGACDGCSLQHLEYSAQLGWKARVVGDALRRIGGVGVEDPVVAPSPRELRYRNKVTFTLRRLEPGHVVAGLRERTNPGRVLDLGPECLLPEEDLARLWGALRGRWGEDAALLPAGRELRLTLRAGRAGGSLLVRGGRGEGDPEALLAGVPGLLSVWREEKGAAPRCLSGAPALDAEWMGEAVELRGGAFLQVNREAAERLQRELLARVEPVAGLRVVDGYCGGGALGGELARRGASVTGIEADPEAAAMARRREGAGFRVVVGRVEEALAGALPAHLVVLNPPRGGLAEAVPELLRARPPERVAYVSCDAATLARDLKRMGEAFHPAWVGAFDLFPQTGHVETLVVLTHGNG
jgi:23S rRNA (uracil1939-C5)-methyltransferase